MSLYLVLAYSTQSLYAPSSKLIIDASNEDQYFSTREHTGQKEEEVPICISRSTGQDAKAR